jgi:hypothetical protein
MQDASTSASKHTCYVATLLAGALATNLATNLLSMLNSNNDETWFSACKTDEMQISASRCRYQQAAFSQKNTSLAALQASVMAKTAQSCMRAPLQQIYILCCATQDMCKPKHRF